MMRLEDWDTVLGLIEKIINIFKIEGEEKQGLVTNGNN
jgi:hypothetical protein